jgi:hypothetical protein
MAETAAVEIVADDVLRASALTETVLAFAPPTTALVSSVLSSMIFRMVFTPGSAQR